MITGRREIVLNEESLLTLTLATHKIPSKNEDVEVASKVTNRDGKSWTWYKANYPAMTLLRYLERSGEHYIAVISASGELLDVYEIAKLLNYQLVALTDGIPVYDGRDLEITEQMTLKKSVAIDLKVRVKLTSAEIMVERFLLEQKNKERASKVAEEKMLKEKKRAEAEAHRLRIEARPRISGFNEDKKVWNGTPVVGDEWLKLHDGAYCIEVTSYDDAKRTPGEAISCFIVSKDGARKKKVKVSDFYKTPLTATSVKAIGQVMYLDGGIPKSVQVYKSLEDLEKLRAAGLNGGAVVALRKEEEVFSRFSVTSDKLKPLTEVKGSFTPY